MRTGHDPRLFFNPHSDEAYTAALVKALSQLNPSKANLQIFFDIPDEIFKRRVLQALPEKVRAKYIQYLSEDTNLMHRYQQQPFFTLEEKKRLEYVDPSDSLKTKCINVLSKMVEYSPIRNFPALVAVSDPFIQKQVLENCRKTLIKSFISNSDFRKIYKEAAEEFDAEYQNYKIAAEDKKSNDVKGKNPFAEILQCMDPNLILKNDSSFIADNADPKNRYGIYQDKNDQTLFVIKEKYIKCGTKSTDFVSEIIVKDLYLLKTDSKDSTVKLYDADDKDMKSPLPLSKLKDILESTTITMMEEVMPNMFGKEESTSPPLSPHISYGCHGY